MENPGGHRASFSQLSLAASCGEAYRRKYIAGEDEPSGLPAEAGTAVHQAIEVWEPEHGAAAVSATDGTELLDLAKAFLRAVPDVRQMRHYGKQDFDWWITEGLKARVDNYLSHRKAELASGWTWWAGVETPFEIPLAATFADYDFTGYVDQALSDSRGRVVLRDVKSGREKASHAMQVELYCLAIRQRYDLDRDDVYGQVLYLNGKKPKVIPVAPILDVADADRMVADLLAMREHSLFPVTGPFTGHCDVCSFRPDCVFGHVGLSNTRRREGSA